ncbi:oxidoreductase [Nocardioides sp. GCM10027113]|uniref:oxidoreductase n=1 Tax=unclassified Nocardioides TaxID=2615069 RepID=UPI0036232DFF
MRNHLGTLALTLALLPAGLAATGTVASAAPGDDRPDRDRPRDNGWTTAVVDPDQSFRGLDAVNRRTAWVTGGSVSGGAGRVFRTTDSGGSWTDVTPDGTDGLMLRDVEARGRDTAVVLAIGPGEASRIYRTTDGGESWTETFRNTDEAAFYNCLDFFPGGKRGLAVSDPVDGRFRVISTRDGGRSWEVLPTEGMPAADGEYNFSASGDCLVIAGRHAWFGTGGEQARVLHSDDRGRTWHATDSGLAAGEAAGVFALAMKNPRRGVLVGGDFAAPADGTGAAAVTRSGGGSWAGGADLPHLGEDAAWVQGRRATVLAVGEGGGEGGTAISRDGGRTWATWSDEAFHTLDCTRDGACWAAGGGGRVGTLS